MSPKQAKVRYESGGCALDDVVRMVKSAMPYIDGTASVQFTVRGSGKNMMVSAFKLTNNHDVQPELRERGFEDDEGGRGGIPR